MGKAVLRTVKSLMIQHTEFGLAAQMISDGTCARPLPDVQTYKALLIHLNQVRRGQPSAPASREPENRASPDLKVGAGRLVNAFLRYHFNSVAGAYHSTNTAPFTVAIINLNLVLVTILRYG